MFGFIRNWSPVELNRGIITGAQHSTEISRSVHAEQTVSCNVEAEADSNSTDELFQKRWNDEWSFADGAVVLLKLVLKRTNECSETDGDKNRATRCCSSELGGFTHRLQQQQLYFGEATWSIALCSLCGPLSAHLFIKSTKVRLWDSNCAPSSASGRNAPLICLFLISWW